MLGMEDPWVAAAYLLCILSSLVCVVYGAVNWNRGGGPGPDESESHWAEEEDRIEEEF